MQRLPSGSFSLLLKVMFFLPFFIFRTLKKLCLGWFAQCSSWFQRSLVLRFPIRTPSCPLFYGLQKMHFLNARKGAWDTLNLQRNCSCDMSVVLTFKNLAKTFWWDLVTLQGEGNGNPLQYSCLENPVDRGAWWAAVHRVAESDTTEAT